MKQSILFAFCYCAHILCSAQNIPKISNDLGQPLWKLVYENDSLGKDIYGTKADLLAYVRKGNIVRIGYSINTLNGVLEHYFPADYISVFGNEVFAQAKGMTSQSWDHPSFTIWLGNASFSFHYLYSTNGHADEMGISLETNKKVFHLQSRRQLKWFVQQ